MERPTFSVIIPTYNRAHTILRSVLSVLAQTCPDFELIIVDDGSTDSTPELVGSLSDSRVRYVSQANGGRSAARNTGAAIARGKYLTFLDSDDEVMPGWLSALVAASENESACVVCCGAYVYSYDAGSCLPETRLVLPQLMGPSFGRICGPFLAGTFVIRRDVFLSIGGYVAGLEQDENTELGMRLGAYCAANDLNSVCVNEPLVCYHRHREFDPHDWNLFLCLLNSNKYMLENYLPALRREPHRYVNCCVIAGVNAARLGRTIEARRFFRLAIQHDPRNWMQYARYIMAAVPPLGRIVWLRNDGLRRKPVKRKASSRFFNTRQSSDTCSR